jgi:hypothetical protein
MWGIIFVDGRLCIDIFENKKRYIYLNMHIGICRRGLMPLTRKARMVGSSLVITIPSQLAEANDINDGDDLEIIPSALGEFKIRKTKK